MQNGKGKITEIIAGFGRTISLRIDSSPDLIPDPGAYLLAHREGESHSPLAVPLFRGGIPDSEEKHPVLQSVNRLPSTWGPGTVLTLRGPLGHGFAPPAEIDHLALATLGTGLERLLPLARPALDSGADVTIFTPEPLPADFLTFLPPAIEAHPLSALPESFAWADFLALELSARALADLRSILGLPPHIKIPCLTQVLITTPMPCGAMADCGACAVPAHRSYKLACKEGPVFDLNQLSW
jgi:NAD(P)H-flavin reductase